MPDWTPNWEDVVFDHAAALEAADECRHVAAKLAFTRNEALPAPALTARLDWTGRLADEFDLIMPAINTDLDEACAAILQLSIDIEAASTAATTEQTQRVADRERWHLESAAEMLETGCGLPGGPNPPC